MKPAPQQYAPLALTDALNQVVAQAITLKLQTKQAHWNIRGSNFIMWHELLDQLATLADAITDSVAERVVQIEGMAHGLTHDLPATVDVRATRTIADHVNAVLTQARALQATLKTAIEAAANAEDKVSEDLGISSLSDLDKQVWFIRAHEVA